MKSWSSLSKIVGNNEALAGFWWRKGEGSKRKVLGHLGDFLALGNSDLSKVIGPNHISRKGIW